MPNLGIWMDVLDANNKWFPGQIVQVDLVHRLVKVHYYNWPSDHDEWINGDSYRLAPLHRFTETHSLNGLFKKSEEFKDAASLERQKCVAAPRATLNFKASVQNELKFRELLKKKLGAVIVDMENDGNCLFRSISHQVYGDPSFHHIVRAKCVDYLVNSDLIDSHF
jgi:OTU domain-containing protein 5